MNTEDEFPNASEMQIIEESAISYDAPVLSFNELANSDVLASHYVVTGLPERTEALLVSATDRSTQAPVLLRLVGPGESPEAFARLICEGFRLKIFPHRAIQPVLAVQALGRRPCIVFEKPTSLRLLDILRRRRELPFDEVVDLLLPMGEAADHAAIAGMETLLFDAESIRLHCAGTVELGDTTALIERPLDQWPGLRVRVSSSLASKRQVDWGVANGQNGKVRPTWPAPILSFARLAYELLGGQRDALRSGIPVPPLSRLSEKANRQMLNFLSGVSSDHEQPATTFVWSLMPYKTTSSRRPVSRTFSPYSKKSLRN